MLKIKFNKKKSISIHEAYNWDINIEFDKSKFKLFLHCVYKNKIVMCQNVH